MNEMQKQAARDAFAEHLRRAGKVDPLFQHAEKRWHTAKAHVAKGHEEEKRRLQNEGTRYGIATGNIIGGLTAMGLKGGFGPIALGTIAGAGLGALAGHRLGAWEADRRLNLSQTRGPGGTYIPYPTKTAAAGILGAIAPATRTVLGQTAVASRSQIRAVKRARVKPVQHKPMKVETPAPAPPRVEPATSTPSQMPTPFSAAGKLGAANAIKDRTTAGEPRTGGKPQRPGENMTTRKNKPSNEPVVFTNGKPHDF
jgi:hypothetical protein